MKFKFFQDETNMVVKDEKKTEEDKKNEAIKDEEMKVDDIKEGEKNSVMKEEVNDKLEEALYEEEIIEGFSFCAFETFKGLQVRF